MSTATTNYGFRKDAPTEKYDVAVVNQNLDSIDTQLKTEADARAAAISALGITKIQRGSVSVTTASGSGTAAVTFPTAYAAGVVPTVMTNLNTGAGGTNGFTSRAINISNTGFTVFVLDGTGAVTVAVQWLAVV